MQFSHLILIGQISGGFHSYLDAFFVVVANRKYCFTIEKVTVFSGKLCIFFLFYPDLVG